VTIIDNITIAGAILAGGASSRFNGRPKGLLGLPGGQTFVERLSDAMAGAGVQERVISSGDPGIYSFTGLRVIPDLTPGRGPLGGIEAALHHFANRADGVLFVPCDMPNFGSSEMVRLKEHFRRGRHRVVMAESSEGFVHSLCGIVRVDTLGDVARAVRDGRLRPLELWQELGLERVRFDDPGPFVNVNTPADYDEIGGEPSGEPESPQRPGRSKNKTRNETKES
jgi:molybdopterin-guanine dinucleotide biosynthesis protein A